MGQKVSKMGQKLPKSMPDPQKQAKYGPNPGPPLPNGLNTAQIQAWTPILGKISGPDPPEMAKNWLNPGPETQNA